LNTQNKQQVLEWIPYNKLKNIEFLAKGGFSVIHKAIWLDGPIDHCIYDNDKKKWSKHDNKEVALKSLNNPSKLSKGFLNEVWN